MLVPSGLWRLGRAGYRRFDDLFHDGRQRFAAQCRAAGDQQWPVRRRHASTSATKHVQFQREMREDMARSGRRSASSPGKGAPFVRRFAIDPRGPAGGRHLAHAAEQAACRAACAAAPRRRRARRRRPRRAAAACRPSAPCTGSSSGSPSTQRQAVVAQRAEHAARPLRRADRRAEIHHRLGEIARPVGRHQRLDAGRGSPAWRAGSGVRDREEPRHHPLDIAVDHRRRPVEGDRRDRRRRVGADARQFAQAGLGVGKAAARQRRDERRRISSGCGRANSSRARPRPSSPLRSRRRRAPRPSATCRRISRK